MRPFPRPRQSEASSRGEPTVDHYWPVPRGSSGGAGSTGARRRLTGDCGRRAESVVERPRRIDDPEQRRVVAFQRESGEDRRQFVLGDVLPFQLLAHVNDLPFAGTYSSKPIQHPVEPDRSRNITWPFDRCYVCRMSSYIDLCRSGYFLNVQLVVRRAGMRPSSLVRREAGQRTCDVSGGK